VQVASFSSEKNANALADSLRAKDLNVLMDVVDRTAGLLHRVRVGPFAERSEADSVVTRLRAELQDLSPRVLDLRPDDSAPVSMPSDPLVRWVVQVGSFDSAEKADINRDKAAALAQKIKADHQLDTYVTTQE
jgi:cell division septation protein DedD